MRAPRLKRKLTLEAPQVLPDGAGGLVQTWTALGQVWAEVKPGGGRERFEAGLPVSRVSHRITVRGAPEGSASRPGPNQRFVDGGRIYKIRAVTERDPAGRYLICFADEEVTA